MLTITKNLIFYAIFLTLLFPAHVGTAAESYQVFDVTLSPSVRFNNENWHTLPHPRVATFSIDNDGSSFGTTENGIPFVQYTVPNKASVRVQRFEIQDHHHYIVDGGVVYTLEELSARLAGVSSQRVLI